MPFAPNARPALVSDEIVIRPLRASQIDEFIYNYAETQSQRRVVQDLVEIPQYGELLRSPLSLTAIIEYVNRHGERPPHLLDAMAWSVLERIRFCLRNY